MLMSPKSLQSSGKETHKSDKYKWKLCKLRYLCGDDLERLVSCYLGKGNWGIIWRWIILGKECGNSRNVENWEVWQWHSLARKRITARLKEQGNGGERTTGDISILSGCVKNAWSTLRTVRNRWQGLGIITLVFWKVHFACILNN